MRIDPTTMVAAATSLNQRDAEDQSTATATASSGTFTDDRLPSLNAVTAGPLLERLRDVADKARSSHRDILAAKLRRELELVDALKLAGPPVQAARIAARHAKDLADLSWHLGIAALMPEPPAAGAGVGTALPAMPSDETSLRGLLRGALGRVRALQHEVEVAEQWDRVTAPPGDGDAELVRLGLVIRLHAARVGRALDHVNVRLAGRDIAL